MVDTGTLVKLALLILLPVLSMCAGSGVEFPDTTHNTNTQHEVRQ